MPFEATRLDAPPPLPPGVSGQMGEGSEGMSGMTQMLGDQVKNGAQPQGALLAQFNAVKKVVEQMASANEEFSPYAMRAIATLQEGIAKVASGGKPGNTPQAGPSVSSPATGPNTGGSGGFVG
jgi:hypothetical protein